MLVTPLLFYFTLTLTFVISKEEKPSWLSFIYKTTKVQKITAWIILKYNSTQNKKNTKKIFNKVEIIEE